MLARLLDAKLRAGDPDAKFLLIAFWNHYGAVTPKPRSQKQLAEDLRLPVQAVSKAVAQLVDVGVLRVVTQPEGKGRPRCTYEMSKAIQSALRDVEERTLNHPGLVKHVLGGERIRAIWSGWKDDAPTAKELNTRSRDEKRVAPVRQGKLSLANRLLLMILLSHADPFGVARGLSSKELCLLTGMDAASLKQRLRRLTELGFIRRHIPGLASPIFAEKLRSVYWLNLNHLQLSPAGDVVSVVLHKKAADLDIDYKFLAGVRLDRNSFLKGGEYLAPRSVVRLFRRAPDHAFDQLELFICDCVLGFLSRHWVQADSAAWRKVRGVDSTVKEQVAAYFRLPMRDPMGKVVLDHDEVFDFLQHQVFELAEEVVQRFSQLSAVNFAGVSYILVPAHVSIGHRCIALLTERASGQGLAKHWMVTKGGDEPVVASVAREVEIPLELREQSGLLTPVRAVG